jgi:hypothetical protein
MTKSKSKSKTVKTHSRKKSLKTVRYRSFSNLHNRAHVKGNTLSIERVKVVSKTPGLEGDLVKKYKNGKLVEQAFVESSKMKEIVEKSQSPLVTGAGLFGKKKAQKQQVQAQQQQQQPQIVYVQQPQPQQVDMVQVQNKTSFGDDVKHGFGLGLGAGVANFAVDAFVGAIFDQQ